MLQFSLETVTINMDDTKLTPMKCGCLYHPNLDDSEHVLCILNIVTHVTIFKKQPQLDVYFFQPKIE